MSIVSSRLQEQWGSFDLETDLLVNTEIFLNSALDIAKEAEQEIDSEFDEEFLAICNRCKSETLISDL